MIPTHLNYFVSFRANTSICRVRNLHISAMVKKKTENYPIDNIIDYNDDIQKANQLDMVVTQWAFCGLLALKWKELGISENSVDCLPGLVHFWRTIGYLMGIEDRLVTLIL